MASPPCHKVCQLLLNACTRACSRNCTDLTLHQASKRHIAGSWNLLTISLFDKGVYNQATRHLYLSQTGHGYSWETLRGNVDLPEGILGVQDRVWDCVKGVFVIASREDCLASAAARRVWRLGSSGQGRAANAPTRLLLWHGRCKPPNAY